VPFMIRWPGRIKPGVSNDMMSNLDWMPTLLVLLCYKCLSRKGISSQAVLVR
jgi:hypothetical protein